MSADARGDAREMLRAAVTAGPWPIAQLKEVLHEAGVSEWHLRQAATSLTQAGELVVVTQKFWIDPSHDVMRNGTPALYAEGHSRAELIRRVSLCAPSPSAQRATTTDDLMRGDDAERLAAQDYGREVESWRGSK